MKRAYPVLKSMWFLLVILLVLINRGIPFPVLVGLTALVIFAPLVREYLFKQRPDERQVEISHFSSHIAYLVFLALNLLVVLRIVWRADEQPLWLFIFLFALPIVVKFAISLFQQYGAVHGMSGLLHVLLRGVLPARTIDERQSAIGNFSSHIAFFVWLVVLVAIIFNKFISRGENPATIWYTLLMTPLLARLYTSFFLTYGGYNGGRFIIYTIVGMVLVFVLLSHGLSLESMVEALPFVIVAALLVWAMRYPRLAGALLCSLAILSIFFFRGWHNFDLYLQIMMFSLIPIPIFIGGVAIMVKPKEE
jgi:hypothetical protein